MSWFLGGFFTGIALDLILTTVQVSGSVYTLRDAPELILWSLAWAPYLGGLAGMIGLFRTRQTGPSVWRWPKFRTRTLMILVAYLAFLLAAFVSSFRFDMIEKSYHQKVNSAEQMVMGYQEHLLKYEAEAKLRRANASQIQAGQIPEGLFPGQADFLRSLDNDPKITPAHRKYRRGMIEATQSDAAARQELASAFCRKIVEYHEQLARKYQQASFRPWLPVEPDPPMPK